MSHIHTCEDIVIRGGIYYPRCRGFTGAVAEAPDVMDVCVICIYVGLKYRCGDIIIIIIFFSEHY